jgi:hypothetical protein
LVPFAPEENQPFDPNLHHLADAESAGEKSGPIARILATGYTFQGQLVRRALVSLNATAGKTVPSRPVENTSAELVETSLDQPAESGPSGIIQSNLSIAELNAKAQKTSHAEPNQPAQDDLLL